MAEYYAHVDFDTNVWDFRQGLVLASAEPAGSETAAFSLTSTDALGLAAGAGASDEPPPAVNVCGITACGTAAWLATGSHLEVTSTRTGQRLAAQSFAAAAGGGGLRSPVIRHVVEVAHPLAVHLFVVVEDHRGGQSLGCLFHVGASRIVRAVSLPYKVTAAAAVDVCPIDCILGGFGGCVALGTATAEVVLLALLIQPGLVGDGDGDEGACWTPCTAARPIEVFRPDEELHLRSPHAHPVFVLGGER